MKIKRNICVQIEMADSEDIKEIVNQVTMQVATVIMIAFRDTVMGSLPATTPDQ